MDEKLREGIAQWILKRDRILSITLPGTIKGWEALPADVKSRYFADTDQILALIKQAGYVKRVDVLREILTIEQTNPLILMEWLKSQISILGKE